MLKFLRSFMLAVSLCMSFGFSVFAPFSIAHAASEPSCTSQKCTFIFLAPLPISGGVTSGQLSIEGEAGAENYIRSLYTFGVAIAAGLAVIMIVIGGIEMSTVDAMSGKIDGSGKKRITAALSGLALALLSYLILSTLNVNLLSTDFVPRAITVDSSIGKGDGGHALAASAGAPGVPGAGVPVAGGPGAQKLVAAATANLGYSTCKVDPKTGGSLACAWSVNKIVDEALGAPIVGQPGKPSTYDLGTVTNHEALLKDKRFVLVGTDLNSAQPGDLLSTPKAGDAHGHTGIVIPNGKVISNSTTQEAISQNYDLIGKKNVGWDGTFNNSGRTTYVFRPL